MQRCCTMSQNSNHLVVEALRPDEQSIVNRRFGSPFGPVGPLPGTLPMRGAPRLRRIPFQAWRNKNARPISLWATVLDVCGLNSVCNSVPNNVKKDYADVHAVAIAQYLVPGCIGLLAVSLTSGRRHPKRNMFTEAAAATGHAHRLAFQLPAHYVSRLPS